MMICMLVTGAALLVTTPAGSGMNGPMSVVDRGNCNTTMVLGVQVTTCAAVPGVHYIIPADAFAANANTPVTVGPSVVTLAQFKDATQTNLENVYAGDDPVHPTITVALTFPDQATADAVKSALGL
jgi:hypothetical protein